SDRLTETVDEPVTSHDPAAASAAMRVLRDFAASARNEAALTWAAVALVGLHVLDDNFLQPQPGTSAGEHLVSRLVPLACIGSGAAVCRRLRRGRGGAIVLLLGFSGVLAGTEAIHYARAVGPSGDDYTGLLSVPAGLLLVGVGSVTLWRSRRRDDRLWWRYGR